MAEFSDVNLSEPAQSPGLKFSMASDEAAAPVKPEFAALTTTKALYSAVELWQSEFKRKDTKRRKPVRHNELFKCDKLRSSLRAYKSGDPFVNMEPLLHERQPYTWLAAPVKSMEILHSDIRYMELQMRNILRVANFVEVTNQAMNKGFDKKFDEARLIKLHRCNRHATGDIIKLATNMFCGLAVLRKDDLLTRSYKIPEMHATKLRHSDIGSAHSLLPEELLAETDLAYTHKLSNTNLERAAYGNRGKQQRGGFHNTRANYQGGNRPGRGHANWNTSEFKSAQHDKGQNSNNR